MFQIIGMASMNQKAREVLPFKSSLTSSGLFLLLSKKRLFFWAGSDFQADYMSDDVLKNEHFYSDLISDELFTKLIDIYDRSQSFSETVNVDDLDDEAGAAQKNSLDLEERKITLCFEGMETSLWHEYLDSEEEPAALADYGKSKKKKGMGMGMADDMSDDDDDEDDDDEKSCDDSKDDLSSEEEYSDI